jgi:hypothetical protein
METGDPPIMVRILRISIAFVVVSCTLALYHFEYVIFVKVNIFTGQRCPAGYSAVAWRI